MSSSKLPLAVDVPSSMIQTFLPGDTARDRLETFARRLENRVVDDRIVIGTLLSSGLYGSVVRGKDISGVNEYAVKVAPLSEVTMIHELKVLKKISDCCWIPTLIADGMINGTHCFVALSMEGVTLRTFCKSFEPAVMPIPTVLNVLYECVLALEYIHGKGIVHRDVHLDNILLSKTNDKGKVVLIDFGLSAIREPNGEFSAAKDVSRMNCVFHTTPEVIYGYQHCEVDDLVQLIYLGLRLCDSSVVANLSSDELADIKTALSEDPWLAIPDEDEFLVAFASAVYQQRLYDENEQNVMPNHKQILEAIETTDGYDAGRGI